MKYDFNEGREEEDDDKDDVRIREEFDVEVFFFGGGCFAMIPKSM